MSEICVSERRKSWYWILKIRSRWWIIADLLVFSCLCNLSAAGFCFLTLPGHLLKWELAADYFSAE